MVPLWSMVWNQISWYTVSFWSTNGTIMCGMGTNINEGMQVFHCAVMIKLVLHTKGYTSLCPS